MGNEVRSIRYFDGLFMKAEEFIQEQNYHTRMRRLHNRYLHSSGIVWGLEIQKSKKPGANPADVTVTQGMALNKIEEDGEEVSKEIILTDDTDVSLSSYGAGKTVYIYISYSREAAPKNSEDSKNIHWLEEGKPVSGTDRTKINEDENVLLGKVSLISANGTVTVDKIDYEENGGSLRKYAGFSGKSLQAEKIIMAINGVTSGFASIEGKQTGANNGIQVNSPITSFAGALSIGDKLGVSGNIQLPDNKSLVLGNTNSVSLHNNSAAPELWLEATGQASSALVIGTAFDADKQVKIKYAPGAVGAAAGELRIGQDVKTAGTSTFTHGITTLYTNGLPRLSIDATGNVSILTGNLKIPSLDTFLDFGADTRQMINLWGNGPNAAYGIGVQGWTQYYRSAGNFAWYIGGIHSDVELDPGAGGSPAMIIKRGSGNTGIGTSNPSSKLTVDIGTIPNQGIELRESSGRNVALRANLGNGSYNPLTQAGDLALIYSGGTINTGSLIIGQWSGSPRGIRIDSNGNVGIGTTNPQSGLQIMNLAAIDESGGYANFGSNAFFDGAWKRIDTTKAGVNLHMNGDGAGQEFRFYRVEADGSKGRNIGVIGSGASFIAEGNVGVGTASPTHKFHVVAADAVGLLESTGTQAYLRLSTSEGLDNRVEITNRPGGRLSLWTAGAGDIFNITRAGNVGIGTISPGSKLTVVGSIAGGETATGWVLGSGAWAPDNWLRLTTTQKGSTYHDLAVNKFWAAGALRFDLAEVTPVKDEDELEQGDVVVIDEENGLRVTRSRKPYDTSVYGIISSYETAAMIIGGAGPETVMRETSKLPIALIGRVKAKVSAEAGAIQVGDLLTTSSTPGHLMKCSNISKATGAVVGKALEAHESGKGIITVLVTLQ